MAAFLGKRKHLLQRRRLWARPPLARYTTWKTIDEVIAELPHWDQETVRQSVTMFREHHLLLAEDDEYDRGLEGHWQRWEDDARFFHFWTRGAFAGSLDNELFQTEDGRWCQDVSSFPWADEIMAENAPPPFKRYPEAPRVYLPRAFLPLTRPYHDVLVSRRSRRHFSPEPVGLRELSTLLHYTFGPMYFADADHFGILQMKTSACGNNDKAAIKNDRLLSANVSGVPPHPTITAPSAGPTIRPMCAPMLVSALALANKRAGVRSGTIAM
jgi:hypothetical protein